MAAREPGWWYAAGDRWEPRLLAPLGWAYGAMTTWRMQRQPRYRANIPVVCVGNFTAGGTGKTPFVALLVEMLRQQGHRPAVLSRGYGGHVAGPHWVEPSDTATEVGDEPLLLASTVEVMVARDRAEGARAVEAATPPRSPATVIVMDDGIQNPGLAKDLTIAVVDAVRGTGNGRCVPAGPLRAPMRVQLGCVDAVLLNVGQAAASQVTVMDAWRGQVAGPILAAQVVPAIEAGWLQGARVVAYAGIGVPEKFFATLESCGADLRGRIGFADHHEFTAEDARRLMALAKAEAATLLTTEKDYARLTGQNGALADLREASRALPIRLQLDAPDTAALAKLLAARVPIRS